MLLLGFGATFELPLLMFLLSRLGVTDYKFYLKYWRHSIFLLFVFSAAITPTTDPLTMALMGGPLAVLYFVGLLMAYVAGRKGPTLLEARLRELDEFKDDFEDDDE
jgi:sec-independent protein translocase protein TatC